MRHSGATYPVWTSRQIWELRERSKAGEDYAAIASAINRPVEAVKARARRLGIFKIERPFWTPEEDAELRRRHALGHPYALIAEAIGRSVNKTIARGWRIGLRVPKAERRARISAAMRARDLAMRTTTDEHRL